MVQNEGRLVGDAILVARSAGLIIDRVVVGVGFVEAIAKNEGVGVEEAFRTFFAAATAAAEPSTR